MTVCKLLRVRSAASTPGGSDEDGGNRRAQESFDGSGGGYKCAGREAGTATICHAAGLSLKGDFTQNPRRGQSHGDLPANLSQSEVPLPLRQTT